MTMRDRIRTVLRGDREAGLGLILVIGVSVFVFTIAMAATALAVNGIAQSRNRTGFETSLALAETGIDRAMASVQIAYDEMGLDYPIPGPASAVDPDPWCEDTPITFPASNPDGVFASEEEEQAWIVPVLESLVGTDCMITDELGQYVVVKPVSATPKYGKVYALAAMPSFAEAERTRVVKSEYIFMPFRPSHAILAGGDLDISSSTLVDGVDAAARAQAAVHSNGSITGSGNPTVYGPVTSTGTSSVTSTRFFGNTGTSVENKATIAIPDVNAFRTRAVAPLGARASWYDLCPNGDVRQYADPATPCSASATLIGTATASTAVRGWLWDSTSRTWIATRNALDGTYYAHEANINMSTGVATFPRMTLIASAADRTSCTAKTYGNITWDHYNLVAPSYGNIFMLADTDIVTTANFSAGRLTPDIISGMFIAGDQIEMQTSSQGAVGSVVTADQCPTPPSRGLITASQVKNPAVFFDPNSEAPFSSIITTALWLDYGRG
ncbi:hypothetical protein N866_10825 [Actinotalea ferrariae CF5-4]|uniref:Type 4 fimbrial biogenesis protein PilX N-terminal domain-containing protein n=1 Tax=Actinotalea ferrariae CF5-4 TaxID=948458 RepID=A0A021VZG0_9CELL|nr:hypothetical protein [Actinotalea ferrariae]EYR64452.1 hypothetical protein N866_10825 [Actinotalea ferrariae CF5-4]